ncbi:hypothetical protein PDE_07105 [Penicillium oxalicum 114-2]|uniref:Uncharacterized protein n=2 Tax=Penicillium oxalicum TaxID=69781 RepID=S7ZTP0_PENO1|nr:hypothetical protein PDE_07105 [Penicillium oxalicum 114-2]
MGTFDAVVSCLGKLSSVPYPASVENGLMCTVGKIQETEAHGPIHLSSARGSSEIGLRSNGNDDRGVSCRRWTGDWVGFARVSTAPLCRFPHFLPGSREVGGETENDTSTHAENVMGCVSRRAPHKCLTRSCTAVPGAFLGRGEKYRVPAPQVRASTSR